MYLPTPVLGKHLDWLIGQLPIKPAQLAERLRAVLAGPPAASVAALTALLTEVLALVAQQRPGFDLAPYQPASFYRRRPWPASPAVG